MSNEGTDHAEAPKPETLTARPLEADKRGRIEASLKLVEGVLDIVYNAQEHTFDIAFKGNFADIEAMMKKVEAEQVACELLSPLEILFCPSVNVPDPAALIGTLQSVSGVTAVVAAGHDYKCYATSESAFEAIPKAAAGAGVKGQVVSHEMIRIKLVSSKESARSREAIRAELMLIPYVLRLQLDSHEFSALVGKGLVDPARFKAVFERFGIGVAD